MVQLVLLFYNSIRNECLLLFSLLHALSSTCTMKCELVLRVEFEFLSDIPVVHLLLSVLLNFELTRCL